MTHLMQSARIIWQRLRRSVTIVGGLLIALISIAYLLGRTPQEVTFLARDWRAVQFVTQGSISTEIPLSSLAVQDSKEAGVVMGEAAMVSISSYVGRPMLTTLKDASFSLIDVSEWDKAIRYDPKTNNYYVALKHRDTGESVEYRQPFQVLPSALSDKVVYRSPEPETLTLEPAEATFPGDITVLKDTPGSWRLNLRRSCWIRAERGVLPLSPKTAMVLLEQSCYYLGGLKMEVSPWTSVSQSAFQLREYGNEGGSPVALVLPWNQRVQAGGTLPISNSGRDYLILIQNGGGLYSSPKGHGTTNVQIRPTISDSVLQQGNKGVVFDMLASRFSLGGPVGKLGIGLQTYTTDDLSTVEIENNSHLYIQWKSSTLMNEDGSIREPLMLSGWSIPANRTRINGEDMILTRWQSQSPEIRAAVLGGVIAAIVSFAVAAWEARRKLAEHSSTADPSIRVPVHHYRRPRRAHFARKQVRRAHLKDRTQ